MDDPNGSEAWSSVSSDLIHRPTSAPPVMELTQQLTTAELPRQGYPPMDPSYFGVNDAAARDYYMDAASQGVHGPLYMVRDASLQNGNSSRTRAFAALHQPFAPGIGSCQVLG